MRTSLSRQPVAISWLSSEKATPQTSSGCSSGSPMGLNVVRSKNRVVLSCDVVAGVGVELFDDVSGCSTPDIRMSFQFPLRSR